MKPRERERRLGYKQVEHWDTRKKKEFDDNCPPYLFYSEDPKDSFGFHVRSTTAHFSVLSLLANHFVNVVS